MKGLFWAFEAQLFDTDTERPHVASVDDLRDSARPHTLKGRPVPAK